MKAKRRWLIAGIIVGALLSAAPIIGFFGTVLGMTQAFSALGSSGVADPQALSNSIGTTLISTAVGFSLFPIGIVILVLSLVFFVRLQNSTPPPLPRPPSQ